MDVIQRIESSQLQTDASHNISSGFTNMSGRKQPDCIGMNPMLEKYLMFWSIEMSNLIYFS